MQKKRKKERKYRQCIQIGWLKETKQNQQKKKPFRLS